MTRKQKKQSSIVVLLILLGGLFVWWQTSDQRVMTVESNRNQEQGSLVGNNQQEEGTDEDEGEMTLDADDPLNQTETEAEARKTSAFTVNAEVCENECTLYTDNPEALLYCQAVCGLSPTEGSAREQPEQCNDRTETAKDICYRDKAVAEKNGALCNEIVDQKLRQSCQNRVAEEYFDE